MGAGTQGWRLGQEEILQASSKSPPSPTNSRGWCRDSDGAICIDDAQCFLDESFRQKCNNNIVQASPLVGHLITKMQRLIAT